jgi:hypothetical protein
MAGMDSGAGRAGARCAMHPTLSATGTCTRCGNFMCPVCSQDGSQSMCPDCRARTGRGERFPLERHSWTFSALWDVCLGAFKREWLMLSVAVLVTGVISGAVQLFGNVVGAAFQLTDSVALIVVLAILAFLLQMAVQGVMGMGMMRVVLDVLQGGKVDLGRLFSQVHKVGRYLGAVLLVMVALVLPLMLLFALLVGVGLLVVGVPLGEFGQEPLNYLPHVMGILFGAGVLVFIPALYFGLPLNLLQAQMAFEDQESPVDAVRHCYLLARGERLSLFGVWLLVFLLAFVGVLACCIGIIPAMALGQTFIGGLYLTLRQGSELEARPR